MLLRISCPILCLAIAFLVFFPADSQASPLSKDSAAASMSVDDFECHPLPLAKMMEATGTITNMTDHTIKQAKIYIWLYSSRDERMGGDSGRMDYNPLLAGQTSPFRVLLNTYNPLIHYCTIQVIALGADSLSGRTAVQVVHAREEEIPPKAEPLEVTIAELIAMAVIGIMTVIVCVSRSKRKAMEAEARKVAKG